MSPGGSRMVSGERNRGEQKYGGWRADRVLVVFVFFPFLFLFLFLGTYREGTVATKKTKTASE
jgi:hypothetical protein